MAAADEIARWSRVTVWLQSRFLAKTPIDPSAMRPGTGGFLGSDVDFWDPHKAQGLKTRQARTAKGRVLSVGVDQSRPDVVILYIMEFGTCA